MNDKVDIASVLYALAILLIVVAVLYFLYFIITKYGGKALSALLRLIKFNRSKIFTKAILLISFAVFLPLSYLNWQDIKNKYLSVSPQEFIKISIVYLPCINQHSKLTIPQISCINVLTNDNIDKFSVFYEMGRDTNECVIKNHANCEIKKLQFPEINCDQENIKITDEDKKSYTEARAFCSDDLSKNFVFIKYSLEQKFTYLIGFIEYLFVFLFLPFFIAHFALWYLVKWIKQGNIK